jgi:uncharacterized protein with PIN domain
VSRIRKGYEARFRALLQQVRARRLEEGVRWLGDKAERLSASSGIPLAEALRRVCSDLAAALAFRKNHSGQRAIRFWCDAGLGGLARWLRAAGYDALWQPGIADDALIREARAASATILTTDSMLMERRLLRDRVIPAFWLPPALGIAEQLGAVFREYGLTVGQPRCMTCGGQLRRGDKEALRERIPPRTYRWLDEYFVCSRCDKLFWHGTHWRRIVDALNALGA